MSAVQKIAHNDFEHVSTKENGRLIPSLKATCCKCGEGEILPNWDGLYSYGQGFAEKNFTRRGWQLGNKRRNDICPRCVEVRRAARNEMREKRQRATLADVFPQQLKIVKPDALPVIEAVAHNATVRARRSEVRQLMEALDAVADVALADVALAKQEEQVQALATIEPPRQMTRADRRIVIAKLEETYIDETAGYSRGWSDKKVADDLGVPRAWVSALRDENFGPESANEETLKAVAEAKAILEQARAHAEQLNEIARDAMKSRDDIRRQIAEAEQRLVSFETLYK